MATKVVVIRHGERLDEANRAEWWKLQKAQPERAHDPPLTQKGWAQARDAGREVVVRLRLSRGDGGVPAGVTLYSSPTSRTLSTAAAISEQLGFISVTPAHGLNCCAAAQCKGVEKAYFSQPPSDHTMGQATTTCWPPKGDVAHVNSMLRRDCGFINLVKELAAVHAPGDIIVLVTHREGIWELQRHMGKRSTTKYCGIDYYAYDHGSSTLSESCGVPSEKPACKSYDHDRALAGGHESSALADWLGCLPSQVRDKVRVKAGKMAFADNLEEVLSRGTGSVIVHRGGVGNGSTLMWRTPGARGDWADGGAVPDGEVVELLSSPQPSEGGEGDFVRVRRKCGFEGWMKVKNLQVPAGIAVHRIQKRKDARQLQVCA